MTVDLCCTDTVSIYDGRGPDSSLLMRIEKGMDPGFITSTGNVIYVHIYLQQHWSCNGVLMKYVKGNIIYIYVAYLILVTLLLVVV